MFERFTSQARDVVIDAKARAESHNYGRVTTEHLLAALAGRGGVAAEALEEVGATAAVIDAALGLDRDALNFLGIDLEQVVARTREMFPETPARSPLRGVRFAAESKKALELALREAIRLTHRHIGAEHILLGILRSPDNGACRLLIKLDISPASIRSKVENAIKSAS